MKSLCRFLLTSVDDVYHILSEHKRTPITFEIADHLMIAQKFTKVYNIFADRSQLVYREINKDKVTYAQIYVQIKHLLN